jgi:hypothetical protein
MSVVAFLPSFTYGSIRRITTYLPCSLCAGRCSSLPNYRNPFSKYVDFTSAASQNFIPNLPGLFPYTEQSDTVSWLKTVAHQLRCFLRTCNIWCSFR